MASWVVYFVNSDAVSVDLQMWVLFSVLWGVYPEVELLDRMVILFNFWRNPCTVFHILHYQEFTCTQVSVSLHSHQHWVFSGGCFVLEGVYVCVRGLNNSHPDGYDVVSHCGFDLFNFVTARSLLCCFCLHIGSLPGFFTFSCMSSLLARPLGPHSISHSSHHLLLNSRWNQPQSFNIGNF